MRIFSLSFFFFIFLTNLTFAQFGDIHVDQLKIDYENDFGSALANKLIIPLKNISWNRDDFYQISLLRDGRDFVLRSPDQEIALKNAPESLLTLKKLNLSDFNTTTFNNNRGISISMKRFFQESTKRFTEIKNTEGKCNNGAVLVGYNFVEQLLKTCFTNAQLGIKEVLTEKFKLENKNTSLDLNHLKDISLEIKNNNFVLKGTIVMTFSRSAKITGTSYLRERDKTIVLKIDSAYVSGWIDVSGLLFDSLRKHPHEKIRVEEPYIYISLN